MLSDTHETVQAMLATVSAYTVESSVPTNIYTFSLLGYHFLHFLSMSLYVIL